MTIFNLWIFDEKGSLLYYKEWLRKKHTSMEKDEVSFQKKKIAFTAAAPAVIFILEIIYRKGNCSMACSSPSSRL
jgi:hypothetical protein